MAKKRRGYYDDIPRIAPSYPVVIGGGEYRRPGRVGPFMAKLLGVAALVGLAGVAVKYGPEAWEKFQRKQTDATTFVVTPSEQDSGSLEPIVSQAEFTSADGSEVVKNAFAFVINPTGTITFNSPDGKPAIGIEVVLAQDDEKAAKLTTARLNAAQYVDTVNGLHPQAVCLRDLAAVVTAAQSHAEMLAAPSVPMATLVQSENAYAMQLNGATNSATLPDVFVYMISDGGARNMLQCVADAAPVATTTTAVTG